VKIKYNNKIKNIKFKKILDKKFNEAIKKLFREYAEELTIDLDFQDFEQELANLPGKYSPPEGVLFLAFLDNKEIGCIAFRKISKDTCEMKRLFVKKAYRGLGIGRKLVSILIEEAKDKNYKYMRLDTIPSLKKAQKLYESFDFYDIEPYVYNPTEGARFMELDLTE